MAPNQTSTSSAATPATAVSPARTTPSNATAAQPLPHSRSDSRSATSSRRPSQPTVAASGSHSQTSPLPSPSLMRAVPPTETATGGIAPARGGENGAGVHGPGPLRHPRPLSPAEMYSQLEQEQEAVVNRLTRELTQLRQQSVSVASSASSASHSEAVVDSAVHLPSGASIYPGPLPIRHRRSSSGTSAQGRNVLAAPVAGMVPGIPPTTTPSQASIERAREGLSRQNSITSTRRSRASSPAQATWPHVEPQPPHYQHRQSLSSHHQYSHQHPHQHHHNHPPPMALSPTNSAFAPSRIEDVERNRAELDVAKKENDLLKRRVRELERVLTVRRRTSTSDAAPVDPSPSPSTTGGGQKTDVAVKGTPRENEQEISTGAEAEKEKDKEKDKGEELGGAEPRGRQSSSPGRTG